MAEPCYATDSLLQKDWQHRQDLPRMNTTDPVWRETASCEQFQDLEGIELRALVGVAGDWMWWTDAQHCFEKLLVLNPAFRDLNTEYSVGKTRIELAQEAVMSRDWQNHLETLERHEPFRDFRYTQLRSNGQVRRISSSGVPRFDANNKFIGYVGVASEIEVTLPSPETTMARERLGNAIEVIDEPVALWDQDDRLVVCNQRFRDMNVVAGAASPNITYAEHLRLIVAAGLIPEAIGREEEWCTDRLQLHRGNSTPFEIIRHDGRCLLVHEQRLADGGVITVKTDITDRRQAEERLRAAKTEAEQANRAKSEFLSLMSHELRTPLNAVLGFVQLLQHSGGPELSDDQQNYIRQIAESGSHLLGQIDQLLDLAKVENGQKPVVLMPVDVAPIVTETLFMLSKLATDAEVKLRNGLVQDRPPKLLVDEVYFRQILVNLVSNAVKYNRPGGSVRIQWSRQFGDRVKLVISDTGLGIPEDKLGELFQPFDRLGREGGPIPGTGVGLALTKRLTQAMNGDCGVTPGSDGGSNFWVTFPIAPDQQLALGSSAQQDTIASVSQDSYILVVGDRQADRLLFRHALRSRRHDRVIEARSASEAISVARIKRPSLIVLDVDVPDSDGYEEVKRLKSDPVLTALPLIVVGKAERREIIEEIDANDHAAFIPKPLQLTALLATLDNFIQQDQTSVPEL